MSNAIPANARTIVRLREHHRCARCRAPAFNGEWHHRRSRRVRDAHRHCPCNGVWLCPTCHRWVHHHPGEARKEGFILSWMVTEPFTEPIHAIDVLRYHDCDGGIREEVL